jgi:hypothetical protein
MEGGLVVVVILFDQGDGGCWQHDNQMIELKDCVFMEL